MYVQESETFRRGYTFEDRPINVTHTHARTHTHTSFLSPQHFTPCTSPYLRGSVGGFVVRRLRVRVPWQPFLFCTVGSDL
jgi:hypothetical protein